MSLTATRAVNWSSDSTSGAPDSYACPELSRTLTFVKDGSGGSVQVIVTASGAASRRSPLAGFDILYCACASALGPVRTSPRAASRMQTVNLRTDLLTPGLRSRAGRSGGPGAAVSHYSDKPQDHRDHSEAEGDEGDRPRGIHV